MKKIISYILVILTILFVGVMSGCIDDAPEPSVVSIVPTPEPFVIPIPPPDSVIDIDVLERYDINNNGVLDEFELKVIETDFHYKRLTNAEIACFVSIIGYTPVINPMPIPTPEFIPTPEKETENPIPDNYYDCGCELPTDISMQEYLSNSEWINEYEAGDWDCSQMAAYMEWSLENCGYNVVIRKAMCEGEDYGHVWILVEFKEGWMAYECTGRYWVYPSEEVARSYDPYGYVVWNPSMYTAGVQHDDIYDVWNSYQQYSNGEEAFLKEYGWWR